MNEGQLIRIFLGESDRHDGKPLYEAIVRFARERGIAGATVLRGMLGYGADSRIHTATILRLSQDLPIIVEIVDDKEKIEEILPDLKKMVGNSLITLEKARIL